MKWLTRNGTWRKEISKAGIYAQEEQTSAARTYEATYRKEIGNANCKNVTPCFVWSSVTRYQVPGINTSIRPVLTFAAGIYLLRQVRLVPNLSIYVNPFCTAVLFWGTIHSNPKWFVPKRDCGPKRVHQVFMYLVQRYVLPHKSYS